MKKWYQSANFYLALALAVGGFWIGFPAGIAGEAVAAIFALFASGGALFQFFKARPDRKGAAWFKDANFWNYITAAVVAVVPTFGADLIAPIRQIFEGLIGGNWNGVIIGVISLATILFKLFRGAAK